MHIVGQCEIDFESDSEATANVYCIAHHWNFNEDGTQKLMVAYLRYHDRFTNSQEGKWLFSERKIFVDNLETRQIKAE